MRYYKYKVDINKKGNIVVGKELKKRAAVIKDETINKIAYSIENLNKLSFEQKAYHTFRGSSLPFCPLRRLLFEKTDYKQSYSIKNDLIFGFGNYVHLVVQKWLGYEGLLYGNWQCERCKTLYSNTKEAVCSKCGVIMTYKEIEIKVGYYFSLHLDGLLELDNKKYILEIKTIDSLKNIDKYSMFTSYKYQPLIYAYITETKLKHKINGIFFVYVDKKEILNNNLKTDITFISYNDNDRKRMKRVFEYFNNKAKLFFDYKKGKVKADIKDLRICKNRKHYDIIFGGKNECPFSGICFNDSNVRDLISD